MSHGQCVKVERYITGVGSLISIVMSSGYQPHVCLTADAFIHGAIQPALVISFYKMAVLIIMSYICI